MAAVSVEPTSLDHPITRRLQTLSIFCYCFMFMLGGPVGYLLLAYLIIFTRFYWIALAYIAFCLGERDIAERGGRRSEWARRWTWWRYCRDYFPIHLIKTAELDPKKNYLLCAVPHGVLILGAGISLATDANAVKKLFPGIQMSASVLSMNFKMPLVRELFLTVGGLSSSKESLSYMLSDPKGGIAVTLAVGGAADALRSRPNSNEVSLMNRKGFIKLALKYGASLVPVYSFGETDLYNQIPTPAGTWLAWSQDFCRKRFGFVPIIPRGSGFLGIIPNRTPVYTVVGTPMDVEKVMEPTDDQINDLHKKFLINLNSLFEAEKHKYLQNADEAILVIS